MSLNDIDFKGFVLYEGIEHLPKDLPMDPGPIRRWAYEKGLVPDYKFQLLVEERAIRPSKIFTSDDEPMLAIAIHENEDGLSYLEYLYIPIKALIRRGDVVKVVFWKMIPNARNVEGEVVSFGEVRLGFWHSATTEEIWTTSNSIKVVEKFRQLTEEVSEEYDVKIQDDGIIDVEVDGDVEARFYKDGRYFNVELKMI